MTSFLRPLSVLSSAIMLLTLPPLSAGAQDTEGVLLELHPHCEEEDRTDCPTFAVNDPVSTQTPTLSPGDTLDIDLVAMNPNGREMERFTVWIPYDPASLEGIEIEPSDDLTSSPGTPAFVADEGYIKIDLSSTSPITDDEVFLARIQLKIVDSAVGDTVLGFFDASGTDESHSGVFAPESAGGDNITAPELGFLMVRIEATGDATASSAGSNASMANRSSSSSNAQGATSSTSSSIDAAPSSLPSAVFALLQVQNVRISTEGGSVYLVWDPLSSSELSGYNVYYGTVSGRYIQRRGVDRSSTSLTLRALPVGTTYYAAIRGVNARGEETEFSQEVGISVGNPATSTAPFTGSVGDFGTGGEAPQTDGTVAGDTGLSTMLIFVILASAVIGTCFALRRQSAAVSSVRS